MVSSTVISNSSLGFTGERGSGSPAHCQKGRDTSLTGEEKCEPHTHAHTPRNAKTEKISLLHK